MAGEVQGATPKLGLQTGIVKKLAGDPASDYRVFVSLPPQHDDATGVWARVATYYASSHAGAVFYPEIGDEVVIGFIDNDPQHPVILGSVYGKRNVPPTPPDGKNSRKSLVTRSRLEIHLDENSKRIEIKTPGRQTITMDDGAAAISLTDSHGNAITMSKDGITLSSNGNITMSALKGDIAISTGSSNIAMSATGNKMTLDAVNLSLRGQAELHLEAAAVTTVRGGGLLELQGAMLTVKGTLVINGLPYKS